MRTGRKEVRSIFYLNWFEKEGAGKLGVPSRLGRTEEILSKYPAHLHEQLHIRKERAFLRTSAPSMFDAQNPVSNN